jgi:hypothetical protein
MISIQSAKASLASEVDGASSRQRRDDYYHEPDYTDTRVDPQ